MEKLRIPWCASSKGTMMNPVTLWLVEQERAIRDVVQRREQDYLRMILRDVVQAWFNFVFVGSDSDSEYDVADFFNWEVTLTMISGLLDSDDAP